MRASPTYTPGAILGNVALPPSAVPAAASFAAAHFDKAEAAEFSDESVETARVPAWLSADMASWLPDMRAFGFSPRMPSAELVMTVGVDQHIDNAYGEILCVVLHNDRLTFRQGRASHQAAPGDYFIFDDRKEHGVKEARGRAVFLALLVPLEKLADKPELRLHARACP